MMCPVGAGRYAGKGLEMKGKNGGKRQRSHLLIAGILSSLLLTAVFITLLSETGFGEVGKDIRPSEKLVAGAKVQVMRIQHVRPGTLNRLFNKAMMMTCQNCGQALPEGISACPDCGWPVPEQECKNAPSDFAYVQSSQRTVDVFFLGFTVIDGGNRNEPDPRYWAIKLSWGNNSKAGYYSLDLNYRGYRIGPLVNQSIDGTDEKWVLMLNRRESEPVAIGMMQSARVTEYYAVIAMNTEKNGIRTYEFYEGDSFSAGGDKYTISEIREDGVLLIDSAGNSLEI